MLDEAQTSVSEDFGTHARLQRQLRPPIRYAGILVIVTERRRMNALLESLANQLSPLLQAECRLLDEGLRASRPGSLGDGQLLLTS